MARGDDPSLLELPASLGLRIAALAFPLGELNRPGTRPASLSVAAEGDTGQNSETVLGLADFRKSRGNAQPIASRDSAEAGADRRVIH